MLCHFFAAADIYNSSIGMRCHQTQWSQKINKPTLQYFVLSMLQQLPLYIYNHSHSNAI